jgi:hypothetical protein
LKFHVFNKKEKKLSPFPRLSLFKAQIWLLADVQSNPKEGMMKSRLNGEEQQPKRKRPPWRRLTQR